MRQRKQKPYQARPSTQGHKQVSKGKVTPKEDIIFVVLDKVWEFFYNGLITREKVKLLGGLLTVACAITYAGYWFGVKLSSSEFERKMTKSLREKTKLDTEIADLKRKLSEKQGQEEPTIETAKSANKSYVNFVEDLNQARSQGDLAVRTLCKRYHNTRLCFKTALSSKWDFVQSIVGLTLPLSLCHGGQRNDSTSTYE